jgi:hypothetical protein
MVRHHLQMFERAVVPEADGDSRCAEAAIADRGFDAGGASRALDVW